MVVLTFSPSTWRQSWRISELEADLAYNVSSRTRNAQTNWVGEGKNNFVPSSWPCNGPGASISVQDSTRRHLYQSPNPGLPISTLLPRGTRHTQVRITPWVLTTVHTAMCYLLVPCCHIFVFLRE